MSLTSKSAFGRRLMPSVLDELARSDKPKLFGAFPNSNDLSDGFRDITVADIARCVDFTAAWIADHFGRSNSCETLAYIGIPDFRGVVAFYAAVKCGYKLLVPSPRNPPSTILSLMKQTSCHRLLYAAEIHPIVKPLLVEDTIQAKEIPSFNDMLNSTPDYFPYDKVFDEASNEPILVLHSSGSTGPPKPIIITHASFAVLDNEKNYPEVPGRKRMDWSIYNLKGEGRTFTVFPFFHLGGFLGLAFNPIMNNACPVLGPPHVLPDSSLINTIKKHYKLQILFLIPSIIDQLLLEPGAMELFEGLDFLVSSGAPLNPTIGDRLAPIVPLISPYGTTEIFIMPELAVEPEDWVFHEFNPRFQHEMQVYDSDEGTYELVVFADDSNKDTSALYHNLPGTKVYRTKDLFTRHPTKPTLFKYYGRRDDIIVLANGLKLNPIPLEAHLQSHQSLRGALMIGNARTHTALIVEPKEALSRSEQEKLMDDLWPLVEESNLLIGSQGRLQKGMLLCTQPKKPFVRTGKGTIIRKLSQALYQEDLDGLYTRASSGSKTVDVDLALGLGKAVDLSDIVNFVRRILSVSFQAANAIDEDEDFFSYGLDSVTTLEIVGNLKHNLSKHHPQALEWVSARTIYQHSNVRALSQLLLEFLNTGSGPVEDVDGEQISVIDELVHKFSSNLPATQATTEKLALQAVSTVVLVGSTGYLGSYAVAGMLRNPDIKHIYCLNRSNDARGRQEAALREISADLETHFPKLHYMTSTLGDPSLGLNASDYKALVDEADVIVYNAWRLDFGRSVRSFEPFLRATRDIIDLAAASRRAPRIVFISSISSVGRMSQTITVPERPVQDPLAAINTGYGQSKLVAERVLANAANASGLPIRIVRVGQVGGPITEGRWPDQAWISALLRTSKTLSCIPDRLAPVDWIPVEVAASMLCNIVTYRGADNDTNKPAAQVYHIYPREALPWSSLVAIMRERHGIAQTLPLQDWCKKLRSVSGDLSTIDVENLPALKLLHHYESLGSGTEFLPIATEQTRAVTKIDISVLDRGTLLRWLTGWGL
ncbi:acetyl-CoA synthetase-like protein [Xylaria cf. heliscus]|nr:acetyl-CoA synthetase-like protein [Xylaria cf. heliscus]